MTELNYEILVKLSNTLLQAISKRDSDPFYHLGKIEAKNIARYIIKNMPKAQQFVSDEGVLFRAVSLIGNTEGINAEFGVYTGNSINFLANLMPDRIIYGFDSFEGLKEDWHGTNLSKQAFDLQGITPTVNKNVTLIKGWFQDTLNGFHESNSIPKPIKYRFVHIDCDTFDSSYYVLSQIKEFLQEGTIIVFDDYFIGRNWKNGEYLAWKMISKEKEIKFDYVAYSPNSAAIKITQINR